MPKVSILIPVYKIPERLLRRCIESSMSQSFSDIEIIIVDDGSPDNCGVICDEYSKFDCRVKVIHGVNKGLAAARNIAYDNASGEYVTFLDGDDYIENDMIEKAINIAEKENVELVYWDLYEDYNNSSVVVETENNCGHYLDHKQCKKLQMALFDFNGNIAHVYAKLIKKKYLDDYNIKHIEKYKQGAEGFIFNYFLFNNLRSAYYLKEPLYHYIYNPISISRTCDDANNYMVLSCFDFLLKQAESERKTDIVDQIYTRLLYVVVTTAVSGYFNPRYKGNYCDRKGKFKQFLDTKLVVEALELGSSASLDKSRRIIIDLIRRKKFLPVMIISVLRQVQKEIR